jgi:hypothetical protein
MGLPHPGEASAGSERPDKGEVIDERQREDAREQVHALERLAADLTDTAYAIAPRHGAGGAWIDLELGLWEALAGAVREWAGSHSRVEMTPARRVGSWPHQSSSSPA